jgi:hypothetical protein
MYSLRAAAQFVNLHPRTLRRWLQAGRITAGKVPGKHGQAWAFDRAQLDALRDAAAIEVEPVLCEVEPQAQADDSAGDLAAPGFDVAGLFAQLGDLRDSQRDATVTTERRAIGGELAALHAQVIALQSQVAAERRRADNADSNAAAARVIVVELREALKYARDLRQWSAAQQGQLPAPGRTTLPFTSGQLRALRSVI